MARSIRYGAETTVRHQDDHLPAAEMPRGVVFAALNVPYLYNGFHRKLFETDALSRMIFRVVYHLVNNNGENIRNQYRNKYAELYEIHDFITV